MTPSGIENLLLFRIHRVSQEIGAIFAARAAELDITPRQLLVLMAVSSMKNVSQTDIVAYAGIDRSTLADIVRRLVTKRLLQRVRSKADARAYEVTLTVAGEDVLSRARPIAAEAEKILCASLPEQDREKLNALLQMLLDHSLARRHTS